MDWIFAIFFVIILLLQGVSWLIKQLRGSEQARMPGQEAAPSSKRGETPMQAVMRMLDEANREDQSRQRPQPRPRPRRAQPQVLRARRVPQPRDQVLADRHLHSSIADRHTGTRRGDELTGFDKGYQRVEYDFWEQLETRAPLQRAVILMEVLGPPRSAQVTQRGRAQRAQSF